jgi:type IV secretory pathway ATPase VirB11/archaellum biosynthesis ATPase
MVEKKELKKEDSSTNNKENNIENPLSALYSYEVRKEGGEDILYINYLGSPYIPSIADYSEVMNKVIDILLEAPNVSRIILSQQKNYNYDFQETKALIELSQFYNYLVKQEKILSINKISPLNTNLFTERYNQLFKFLVLLKKDPVSSFFELKKIIIENKIKLEKTDLFSKQDIENYLFLLNKILSLMENLYIIQKLSPYFDSYKNGEREIYNLIFKPDIIPNFTLTRLISDIPKDAEIIDQYTIGEDEDTSVVTILKNKHETTLFYHLIPPENSLEEEQILLLELAREVLMEHQPKAEEFTDVSRIRQVFFNISKDLLQDLSQAKNITLDYSILNKLASILVRQTIGFGLIEVLLQDKKIQDIMLNSPIPKTNIFIKHEDYNECLTNILPSQSDVDSWAAKFRMISGRPLDESNPILDTQLEIGKIRARIAIIQNPLSPDGIAYAIRKHREEPWTLPLFIQNKMINSFTAGLLSFLIDGGRTVLIAGTRGSGKSSLLGSLMLEILPKNRIIVVEDSLELPVESLRELGFNILRMKVRSALLTNTTEVSADDGIRTSLRLGDSCLIVGEVRSVEAKALYEAMRVGALANVVAGTIHGASPYAVFDRVVNDLEVPTTSFKATDIIVICNPIKSADGLHSKKRVVQVSEVRKHWVNDPVSEKGFVNLLNYNIEKDELEITPDLINGDSEIIKEIASNVHDWVGDWDAVYDNILLRAKIKQELVDSAERIKNNKLLEAKFNVLANQAFHEISDKVREEEGKLSSEKVFSLWKKWLDNQISLNNF